MTTIPGRSDALLTPDGISLALRRWGAVGQPARGTILLVHGLGEHTGRYEHVAAFLTSRGWDVVGFDLRGHGRSNGKRGSVPRRDSLLSDLALVVDHAARTADGLSRPIFLLGHSLGGLIAALFVAREVRLVDGLILSSPALAADLSLAQRLQVGLGDLLTPDLAVSNQLKVDRISHDPAVVRAYRSDPMVHDRITPRLATATLAGGREVRAAAGGWRTPTLLLWAGDDHLVAASGSAEFAAAAPPGCVRARRFDAFYHEIMNEPGAAAVFAAIAEWLDDVASPRS